MRPKSLKNNKAQAILEFTLVLIPFFILLMGTMQLLHIAVMKLLVNHAAFTTARVAAVTENPDQIATAAKNSLFFKDKENITYDYINLTNQGEIQIRIHYKMPLIFPIVNKIIKEVKELPDYNLVVSSEYSLPNENLVN